MQLSNVSICHMSVEMEHKQFFHFMSMKLTLSCIKEHNVDLKAFGASPQINDRYSVVYFSNLRVGVPSFHCCFRLHGSQDCSFGQLDGLWRLLGASGYSCVCGRLGLGPAVSVR